MCFIYSIKSNDKGQEDSLLKRKIPDVAQSQHRGNVISSSGFYIAM